MLNDNPVQRRGNPFEAKAVVARANLAMTVAKTQTTPKEQLRKVVPSAAKANAKGQAQEARTFAEQWLRSHADADAAKQMNAYLRCEEREDAVRFVGVVKPVRKELNRLLKADFAPASPEAFEATVRALWHSPIREACMSGAEMCRFWPRHYFGARYLPLYAELIVESGWWDLADIIAAGVVPRVLVKERQAVTPVVNTWQAHPNVWMRRACILSQLFSKDAADLDVLFANCRARMHEQEFFIRKAIGWGLREASKCFPAEVETFLVDNQAQLSGLSFREGAKVLRKEGRLL